VPGLKVVIPSNAYDAKGLLIQAIRDDDPVIFLEHKLMYDDKGEVPDGAYTVPFGEANVVREGKHATIIAIGRMVKMSETAAASLAKQGIEVTIVDPRTTSPLDEDTILEMVEETGRVVIVDESNPRCSVASDISSIIAEKAFDALEAPIVKVTAPHSPVPYAPSLEDVYVPSPERIEAAVRLVMGKKG
jgi:pyruvate dehydrogenase E1 component beta subunit